MVESKLMSREEVTKQLSPARLSGLEVITTAIPVIDGSAASEKASTQAHSDHAAMGGEFADTLDGHGDR